MREALLFALFGGAGLAAYLWMTGGRHLLLGSTLAVPFGAVMWNFLAIATMAVRLPFAGTAPLAAVAAVALAGGAAWRYRAHTKAVRLLVLVPLAAAAVAGVASVKGWVLLSYDSVEQVAVGRALAMSGWQDDLGSLLASWGSLVPVVQGAGVPAGVDLVRGFHPLMAVSLLALTFLGTWHAAARWKLAASLVSTALVGSCYFVLLQSQYVHNSLPSAVYLLGAATLCARVAERAERELLVPAFFCLAGFTFCRTEAPLFSAMALSMGAALMPAGDLSRHYGRLAAGFCAFVVAWCAILMVVVGAGSDIMTPSRLAVLAAAVAAAGVLAHGLGTGKFEGVRRLLPEGLVAVSLAALVTAAAWNPPHFFSNAWVITRNLLNDGAWGLAWVALLITAPLSLRRTPAGRALLAFTIGFVALVLLFGMARIPYRLGWGDSANRIFTHLLPLLAAGVAAGASGWREPAAQVRRGPRQWRDSALAVGVCAGAVLGLFSAWPTNLAASATAREGDGFCPPDSAGAHDFNVALRPSGPRAYAAACSGGERSVFVELQRASSPRWIELFEYSPEQAWTDWGVSVSADGTRWRTVYDTRRPELASVLLRPDSAQLRVRLPGEEFRFVKIHYRASAGQNRLLLRRLAIY